MTLYLNALGIINPLGRGKDAVAGRLFAGARDGLVLREEWFADRPVRVGVVEGDLPAVPDLLAQCRNNQLALAALLEIEDEVRGAIARFGAHRVGVVVGTSTSGLDEGDRAMTRRLSSGAWPNEFHYRRQELGNLGRFIADRLGVFGPAYTIATACSSSGKAFAAGARLIDGGWCDACVVGGADSLCRLTLGGFRSLDSLAADYCNPMSRHRDGINIGEGAALFLMSRDASPVALLGVGESADAYHVSAPEPQGTGAVRAMERALEAAGLPPAAIDYINLHGTATPLNDAMEARAIETLFGTDIRCSSTKSLTGHMLGAAGANEAAFLYLALDPEFSEGALPPHRYDGVRDPELPPLALVEPGERLQPRRRAAMLSNSFAFGGSNVAVILGRGW
ncbi:MAG TPA: beta-ketoacyl-[acyl-carrier-protein] synthase family protein [Stellaceae bacterium]|nr:beta-ketoacyl-[acyl-carrier-protein] synthase family protein [Stellaceae bacterium]